MTSPHSAVATLTICGAALLCSSAYAQTVKLPVTADNSIVDVNKERSVNMGAASRLRLKAFQHHLALKVDSSGLAGKKVVKATLRYRKGSETLDHVTLSTIQGDWTEGTSTGFSTETGSSCFLAAKYDADAKQVTPWAFPGSRFVDVVYGNGHSLLGFSKCPVVGGFYEWQVPADLVNAMAVGAAYGLAVFESSGIVSRNPTVYSREGSSAGARPELVVTTAAADPAPAAVTNLAATAKGLDRGRAKLSWTVPAGAFAYRVTLEGGAYSTATAVPRYLIPFAGKAGAVQTLELRDVIEAGKQYTARVIAVARGGAASPASSVTFSASAVETFPDSKRAVTLPASAGSGYSMGDLKVWAVPVTDKVRPDGTVLEAKDAAYKTHNAVFDGKTVRLIGGRSDLLAFQLVLQSTGAPVTGLKVSLDTLGLLAGGHRIGFINTAGGLASEVIRPGQAAFATNGDENAGSKGQKAQPVLAEVWVPASTKAGVHSGTIVVSGSAGQLSIPLQVQVVAVDVPDANSFKLEMNDYGYPDHLATFNALQKEARRWRAHVNLLPYGHTGRTRMDMVMLDGKRMSEATYNDIKAGATSGNWAEFKTVFGPLLGAGKSQNDFWPGAPLSGFYTTFYESWPVKAKGNYKTGEKDAYLAFPKVYEQTFKAVLADFVALAKKEKWTAGFQVYLNNKPYKGDPAWTLVSGSTPWTLDEPYNYWDFRALGYFGKLFHEGAGQHAPVKIDYRIDISRYPYHRGQLDGVVDLAVVNRDLYLFRRLIFAHARTNKTEIWNYGTANTPASSNLAAAGWVLSCYALGCRGLVPWSTVKYGDKYLTGVTSGDSQQRALFIVAADGKTPKVYGTLRLAAFREAALIVEYLELLRARTGATEGQMERLIRNYLSLDAAFSVSGAYAEDAGTISFKDLTSTQLWQLRRHALEALVAAPPLPDGGGSVGDSGPAGDGSGGQDPGDDGCGCAHASAPYSAPGLLLLLAAVLWIRRRS